MKKTEMSLGPVMVDLLGVILSPEENEMLQHPQVGGVILFARNYHDPQQLQELIEKIRHNNQRHLLITVDQEGGRVQRFKEGFTLLPPLGRIGDLYEHHDHQTAKDFALHHSWLMAAELLAAGIDLSFAPVMDLNKNISRVIGDRAFHSNPNLVANFSEIYLKGMHEAGMATVGKHFPGHGSIVADSHVELPIDPRPYDDIANEDLIPFQQNIHTLKAIMPAHVVYSAVDQYPAGFSPFWLQTILRQKLGFTGAVFSDDLNMVGASAMGNNATERAQRALNAGCDMVLLCNHRADAIAVLEGFEQQALRPDPQSLTRLQNLIPSQKYQREVLYKMPRWQQAYDFLRRYS